MRGNCRWKRYGYAGLVVVLLVLVYLLGLGLRRSVLAAQGERYGSALPFTLESALHFRRVSQILEGGGLMAHDAWVEYPEGVDVWRTYTVGSEYLQAGWARMLVRYGDLTARLRLMEAVWFCLGIPLLACWVRWAFGSWLGGLAGAGCYAVNLGSVIRSTGQELSRENTALPLLVGFLALDALAERVHSRGRRLAAAVGSALLLALGYLAWDLSQYLVGLWLASCWWRLGRSGPSDDGRAVTTWSIQFAGLVLAGLVHPYQRAHGSLLSPVLLLGWGLALLLALRAVSGRWPALSWSRRGWAGLVLPLALLGAGWCLAGGFRENYQHFGELLWAKIRFLNSKPADPGLLTFNQRILWVPALHSANFRLTFAYFPIMLLLGTAGTFIVLDRAWSRSHPGLYRLIFFSGAALVTFCLFVRFHVYLSLFLAALVGAAVSWSLTCRGWRALPFLVLVLAGGAAEARHTWSGRSGWGRQGVYYHELEALAEWCTEHGECRPVLANFGTSAFVLTYGHCPILLHPKFESPRIRGLVRAYGEELFKGTERSFRDWADRHGAVYYVHGRGELASTRPEYQMRYFVDALEPPPDSPVRQFEGAADGLEYFRLVWENRKYRVFRIRTRADEAEAVRWASEAEQGFQQGDLDAAERAALEALTLDPRNERALKIMRHASALRERGFSYDPP